VLSSNHPVHVLVSFAAEMRLVVIEEHHPGLRSEWTPSRTRTGNHGFAQYNIPVLDQLARRNHGFAQYNIQVLDQLVRRKSRTHLVLRTSISIYLTRVRV
jgi:hypothetical protein